MSGVTRRVIEVCIGVVFSLVTLYALAAFLYGAWGLVFGFDYPLNWPMWAPVIVTLVSGGIAWWGARASWELFTGRGRPGGWLLSPLVLISVAVVSIALVVSMLEHFGLWPVLLGLGGVALGGLVYVRVRRETRRG